MQHPFSWHFSFVQNCRTKTLKEENETILSRLRSIGKSGFRCKIQKWISPRSAEKSVLGMDFNYEIQIRISWISLLAFDWVIRKRIRKLSSWTAVFFLPNYAWAWRPLFLRTVFQILFRIYRSNGKKEIQKQIFQPWNPFSDFAFNFKSEIRILKS